VLERLASPVSVQTIVGRYWAFSARSRLNFSNLDSAGGQRYQVKCPPPEVSLQGGSDGRRW
jgi:hypothetical protein